MASSSLVVRFVVVGLGAAALVACTSALGNFTVDDALDGGASSSKDSGGALADGSSTVSDAAGTGSDGSVPANDGGKKCAQVPYIYMFVTSEMDDGALKMVSGASGRCAALANLGHLPGTYSALLGSAAASTQNIPKIPVYLPDCTLVLAQADLLLAKEKTLLHPIDRDEQGAKVNPGPVWTGLKTDGSVASDTCTNWTLGSMLAKGVVGNIGPTDPTWLDNGTPLPCDSEAHLYCVQTGQ